MGASVRRSRRSSGDRTRTGIQIPRSRRYRVTSFPSSSLYLFSEFFDSEKRYKDEDENDVTVDAYVPVEKPKYPESVLGVAKFEKDYAAVEKKKDRYQSSKRELMSKMLLAMEEDIDLQVSQHEMFDY
jgi:hypothetical protein